MKTKFTLLLALTIGCTTVASSQSLREKMKAKLEAADKKFIEKMNGKAYQPNFNLESSQNEAATIWKEGSYAYYQQKEGRWKETNKTNMKLLKNANGDITSVKLGGGEYKLQGLDKGFGKYYFYKDYNLGLIMDSSIMVIFKTYNYSIIATVNNKLSNVDKETEGKIKEYVLNAEKLITEKGNELAEKKAAERKAKYGLEGKVVSKVEIVNLKAGKNGKIGCYSHVSYDIVATLKDGTKISTADGGYYSDYNITIKDSKISGGKIKAAIFEDDKLSIDVVVKSNPAKKAHKELDIPYNQAISFNWSGTGWSRSRGESARNIIIEIKQTKHTETGADLLKVRIKNVAGTVLSEFKIAPDMNIIVKLIGGYGGNDDGTIYPGGNGGNITVVKDPNVKFYSLDANLNGGRGGKHSSGRVAQSGRDGKVKEVTRPVNL